MTWGFQQERDRAIHSEGDSDKNGVRARSQNDIDWEVDSPTK